jgi:hypothetical protein
MALLTVFAVIILTVKIIGVKMESDYKAILNLGLTKLKYYKHYAKFIWREQMNIF